MAGTRSPLRCRLGWHKKRPRKGAVAVRTVLLVGVNLYECALCDWRMTGIGEDREASVEVAIEALREGRWHTPTALETLEFDRAIEYLRTWERDR